MERRGACLRFHPLRDLCKALRCILGVKSYIYLPVLLRTVLSILSQLLPMSMHESLLYCGLVMLPRGPLGLLCPDH